MKILIGILLIIGVSLLVVDYTNKSHSAECANLGGTTILDNVGDVRYCEVKPK